MSLYMMAFVDETGFGVIAIETLKLLAALFSHVKVCLHFEKHFLNLINWVEVRGVCWQAMNYIVHQHSELDALSGKAALNPVEEIF